MGIKDFIRIKILEFKYRNNLLLGKSNIIKRTSFEGKNILHDKNKILNSKIGFGTYFGSENSLDKVKVGRYCSIASGLKIITGNHPIENNVSTHPAFFLKKYKNFNKLKLVYVDRDKYSDNNLADREWNAIIGNDVWIGANVTILQGIEIGDGAVIGAGALVTKNVEPYSIVGGIPAKLIRKRFTQENIEFLLNLEWWNRDESWIKKHAELFEDIEKLKKELKREKV
jgi:acetyltransferase-like isoleucine patch superfamily enzyme